MAPQPKYPTPSIGDRFGRYVVLGANAGRQRTCDVRCECGEVRTVRIDYLAKGLAQSCGCLRTDRLVAHSTTHGETPKHDSFTSEYQCWLNMRHRCSDPAIKGYENYGGRGIRVCERWENSFENFLTDMGRKPTPAHSIDRYPDNNGNYEPGNVRWATRAEQAANKRPARLPNRDDSSGRFLPGSVSSKD